MAGTEITSTSKMLEVGNEVEGIISRYDQSIERMYRIGGEVDTMWDGEASNKFMATLGNDRERFAALTRMLKAYVETLRQDVATYVRAESDALNILNTNTKR